MIYCPNIMFLYSHVYRQTYQLILLLHYRFRLPAGEQANKKFFSHSLREDRRSPEHSQLTAAVGQQSRIKVEHVGIAIAVRG